MPLPKRSSTPQKGGQADVPHPPPELARNTVADRVRDGINSATEAKKGPQPDDEQKLIQTLGKRYDKLNELWRRAEDGLRKFLVPHEVQFVYESYPDSFNPNDPDSQYSGHAHFGWAKHNGTWRICHGWSHDRWPEDDIDWKPITDCTVDLRTRCVPEFVTLRDAMLAKAKETVPELDAAIATLSAALNS